jgi:hypothetical protein
MADSDLLLYGSVISEEIQQAIQNGILKNIYEIHRCYGNLQVGKFL